VVAKSSWPARNYGLWVVADGSLHLSYVNSGGTNVYLFTAPGLISAGTWSHVTGVIDTVHGVMKVYVNGQLVASHATSGAMVPDSAPLTVGTSDGSYFFPGLIDEVQVYNRALGPSEVLTLASLPFPSTDQRGMARPGSGADVGAFQSQAGLVVNTTADSSGAVAPGLISLRDAMNLADANSTTTAQAITFDPSVFAQAQTITLNSGTLALTSTTVPVSITAPAAGLTVDGNNQVTVFSIAAGATVTLNDLTISHGSATVLDDDADGGGIFNSGSLTTNGCTFASSVGYLGGGIFNSGTLTASDCAFASNLAQYGGAVYNTGTLLVSGSTISGNTGTWGGGIYSTGNLTLSGSTLSGNSATSTGGSLNNYTGGQATVSNCAFTGNSAGSFGGAIANAGTLTLGASSLSDNTAGGDGGAVGNVGNLAMASDYLFGNTAVAGGALYNKGAVTDSGSSIQGNVAVEGGGIANHGTLTLDQSDIELNHLRAPTDNDSLPPGGLAEGGGLCSAVNAVLNLGSSTVANNHAADGITLDNVFLALSS
jgi:hypothetical protein